MDCRKTMALIQDEIDGLLPPEVSVEVKRHMQACGDCAAEAAGYRRVGELLRAWTGLRAAGRAPQLDAMWTRVSAGIEERKGRSAAFEWAKKWLWLPAAAALVVWALVFYPSSVNKAPFHPTSFNVTVEEIESDAATVALVDKGDDLPRVIWIIENDKT